MKDEQKSSKCAGATNDKYSSIHGHNQISPSDGQQLGGRVTPKREELPEVGGIQGEGGVPRGDDENLEEQADNGQTEALGGLVASVKQLQVSELILLWPRENNTCRAGRAQGPKSPGGQAGCGRLQAPRVWLHPEDPPQGGREEGRHGEVQAPHPTGHRGG